MIKNYLSALVLFLVPLGAFAYDFESGGIYYNVTSADDKTCEVTYLELYANSSAYSGDVNIPSSVENGGTTYSVTSIGDMAFQNCSGLNSVNIPESVTSIGSSAFWYSSLTTLTIPNSVTTIAPRTFYNCSGLTTLTIPNSVTSIGDDAFYNCSGLKSLTIPNSVTSIGQTAFSRCSGLKSLTIPASVTSISRAMLNNCSGLTSVTILGPVTSIGNMAFAGCSSLTSLTIPASVTSIGDATFMKCYSLTSLTIPASVTSIGVDAFYECSSLEAIEVDKDNRYFTSENGLLFNADKTTLLAVPAKASSVVIPNSVTNIGDFAFYGCSGLTSLTIPCSVTNIGNYAFQNCSGLTSLTISASVTSIGNWAFHNCSSLTSLTIPASVTSIGERAFAGCVGIMRLECLADVPPTCGSYPIDGLDITQCELVVPEGSIDDYQTAEWLNEFLNKSGIKVYNVAIDALGYVTRCFADNVDFSGSGLTAYVVSTYDDATAMLTEVTGVVPSGEGVILYAAYPGTYSLFPSEADATDENLEGNKLMGVLADTNVDSGTAYVLADDGADGVEFALLSDDTNSDGGNVVPANRAYLPVNATTFAAPQTLSFTFGTPTAIESVTVAADEAEVMWYTLSGVPVKNPSKGIFVNNKGKVVLFK